MGKKVTALALAALLALGLSGCGSSTDNTANGTRSNYDTRSTYDNRDDCINGFGRSQGLGDDMSRGFNNAVDNAEDALSGDSRRFQEMLENGRVHDSDGFLLDGENRHD